MKKLLFFAITLMIVSCNNKKEDQEGNNNMRDTEIESPDATDEKDSNKPDLQSFIIINKSGFPADSLKELKDKHAIALELSDVYYVDLLSIDNTEAGIAAWLKNNDGYINFSKSYPFIEVAHNLRALQDLSVVTSTSIQYKTYRWEDLKNYMTDQSEPHGANGNHYNHYLNLGSATGSITLGKSNFDQNNVIYSTALFNSIIENHGLGNKNPEIGFAKATLRNYPTIFIRVRDGGNVVGYYDFTHRPPDKQIETKNVTYSFL